MKRRPLILAVVLIVAAVACIAPFWCYQVAFTPSVMQSLEATRHLGDRLGHSSLTSVHLLLGVLSVQSGHAIDLLRTVGADSAAVTRQANAALSAA